MTLLNASIWFGVGTLLEAILLLRTNNEKFSRTDLLKLIGGLLGAGLLGVFLTVKLAQERMSVEYTLAFFIVFAIIFATIFRKRLLPMIDEQTLLIWNIVFAYAYFTRFPQLDALAIVIILVSLTTLINALSPLSPNAYGKALLYVWFLVMVIFLGISQFAFGNLAIFIPGKAALGAAPSGFGLLLTGMAFLYIAMNAWWVLRLIPLPNENQSIEERLEKFHADVALINSKYQTTQFAPLQIGVILVLLGGSLVVNHLAYALPDWLLIDFGIATLPFLGAKRQINP